MCLGWERVLLRDGAVDLPFHGPASAAPVRTLLGEVPRVTAHLDAVTRNANGMSRYSTKAGEVEELDLLTHAAFLPLARRVAAEDARMGGGGGGSGGMVDHFRARRATLLTSDAHDGWQRGHIDKLEGLESRRWASI